MISIARSFAQMGTWAAAALVMAVLALTPAPAAAQSGESIEFARANTCELLRAYIAKYPNGRHLGDARAALRTRNCPDPAEQARRARAEAEEARARQAALENQIAAERARRLEAERKAATPPPPVITTPAPRPPAATGTDTGAWGLDLLHPDVRRAVLAARDAEVRANAAAVRARAAAQQGEAAAERARRGAPGTRVDTEPNGGIYSGDWSNNTATGYGTRLSGPQTSFAGDKYAGLWRADMKDQLGVYTYGNNSSNVGGSVSYEGEYANDTTNGFGVFTWRTGDRFAGGQRNGKRGGYGVYRFADGVRFEGQYEADRRVGAGVLWDRNGRILSAGIWDGDRLATPLTR